MPWKCSICPIASPRNPPPVQGWHGGFAREFPGDPSQECVCQHQGLTSASAQECPTDLVDCLKKLQEALPTEPQRQVPELAPVFAICLGNVNLPQSAPRRSGDCHGNLSGNSRNCCRGLVQVPPRIHEWKCTRAPALPISLRFLKDPAPPPRRAIPGGMPEIAGLCFRSICQDSPTIQEFKCPTMPHEFRRDSAPPSPGNPKPSTRDRSQLSKCPGNFSVPQGVFQEAPEIAQQGRKIVRPPSPLQT